MEGQLLSGKAARKGYAALLLREAEGSGAKQHFLSITKTGDGGELEKPGAGQLSLLTKSLTAHHAFQTLKGSGRGHEVHARYR